MTSPAGYRVRTSAGQTMLILNHANAVDKAVLHRGTLSPLYSPEQILLEIEDCEDFEAARFAISKMSITE